MNVGSRTEVHEYTFKSFKPNEESKKIRLFISIISESVGEHDIKKYISNKGRN